MKNKKAQGMSTNTIILLILGIAVLVVLILGFTMGWQKVAPFISGSNVDTISSSCQAACSTGSKYDFCTAERELKDLEKNKIKTSCTVFSGEKSLAKYGIQTCAIDCKKPCNQIMINGAAGIKTDSGQTGKYDVTFLANDLVEGQLCLIN
ncbi:hypothetical protein GW932_02095 [archaeon]|nr:hypothetical protein [archaeon]